MAATARDDEDIELDDDGDVDNDARCVQEGVARHGDDDACDDSMWRWGARDELGCLSSDSDSDDDLYLPYPPEPSRVDGTSSKWQHYRCCCCPLAPLQHQTQLICEQLCARRGWQLYPSEVISGGRCPAMMGPEGRGRPLAGRRVDFSNSAFHSTGWLFSDDPCEALYDRLQLAKLVRSASILSSGADTAGTAGTPQSLTSPPPADTA